MAQAVQQTNLKEAAERLRELKGVFVPIRFWKKHGKQTLMLKEFSDVSHLNDGVSLVPHGQNLIEWKWMIKFSIDLDIGFQTLLVDLGHKTQDILRSQDTRMPDSAMIEEYPISCDFDLDQGRET